MLCFVLNSWVEKGLASPAGLQNNWTNRPDGYWRTFGPQSTVAYISRCFVETHHVSIRLARLL